MKVKDLLDADWKRLLFFCGLPSQKRKWRNCLNPRFAPVVVMRIAGSLEMKGWGRFAKCFSLLNFVIFGLEIPAKLKIGPGFVIPHTQGSILGAAEIAENVTIYQQVTLGAKVFDFENDPAKRPRICSGAIITSGAKVLGPVRVGKNTIIGANAVVLKDVPDEKMAVGVPAKIVEKN